MSVAASEGDAPRERRFNVRPTAIAGVVVVDGQPRGDTRGAFMRLYC